MIATTQTVPRVEQRQVAKQRHFMILVGADQHRREKSADHRQGRQQLCILPQSKYSGGHGDQDHCQERNRSGHEMVKLARCPQREIEGADPDRFQRECKARKSFAAEALAPEEKRNAGKDSDRHLSRGTNPVVVEGQLEEIRKSNQHRDDADAIQPLAANARFQRCIEFGMAGRARSHRPRYRRCRFSYADGRYRGRDVDRRGRQCLCARFSLGLDRRVCRNNRIRPMSYQQFFQPVDPASEFCHLLPQAFEFFGMVRIGHTGSASKRLQYAKLKPQAKTKLRGISWPSTARPQIPRLAAVARDDNADADPSVRNACSGRQWT